MVSPPRKARRTADADEDYGDGLSTRTSSRSAKRRSPKEPEPDPELLELERTQFLRAMDRYKRKTGKTFPSWTEVLDVIRDLGWISPAKLETERSKDAPPTPV